MDSTREPFTVNDVFRPEPPKRYKQYIYIYIYIYRYDHPAGDKEIGGKGGGGGNSASMRDQCCDFIDMLRSAVEIICYDYL